MSINPPHETGNAPGEISGYFPPALFKRTVDCDLGWEKIRTPILDEFEDAWYSAHLRAAGERPLPFAPGSREILRFTWLRSFHAPVIVRVEWTSTGAATLTATMLSGAGGYDPGEVSRTVSRPLMPEEAERLLTLRQAALLTPPPSCEIMLDGAQWIVETAGADGYHYVNAQSPQTGAVHELGVVLLDFTDWPVDPIY